MADVRYRYASPTGDFLAGVPARDLTDDDLAALPAEARAALDANVAGAGSIYRPVAAPVKATEPAGGKK